MWFFRGCEHLIHSYDGTHQSIEILKMSHRLGIITNGDHGRQFNRFSALTFRHHFDAELMVCSGSVGYAKPDPRIFRHALESAEVEPKEALMVCDWALGDVAGAQAAGMRGVWFNPEDRDVPESVAPDATIRRFDELPGLLREWSA